MSDKIIDEVMELVDSYAAMQGVDPYDKQVDAHDAIRAKLREVLDRKPLTEEQIERENLHELFREGVRFSEHYHQIGAEQ